MYLETAEHIPDDEEFETPPDGPLARLKGLLRAGIVAVRRGTQAITARFQRAPSEGEEEIAEAKAEARIEAIADDEERDAPPDGLPARLKRLLRAVIVAMRRVKQAIAARFQRAPAEGEEEAEADESHVDSRSASRPDSHRNTRADETDEAEEPVAAPRSWWRSLAIYASVLLIGAGAGGSGAYYYLSDLIATRSVEITRQRNEIVRQAKYVAEAKRKIEAQQAKRIEAENRLALMLADGKIPQAGLAAGDSAGSSQGAADPHNGNCKLRSGDVGASLKDCIADFNRK